MICSLETFSVVFLFSTLLRSLKPVIDITLFIFTIYLSTLVSDVITIVLTDGKIKVSIGEQECQQVNGSLD